MYVKTMGTAVLFVGILVGLMALLTTSTLSNVLAQPWYPCTENFTKTNPA